MKVVYTTNFDLLLEKALEKEGLIEGEHFRVYQSEHLLKSVLWNEDVIHIIKIHGCISDKSEMAITLSQLASNKYYETRKKLIDDIFGAKVCEGVIVMGYSCSDVDLVPLIESVTGKKSELFFIDHLQETNILTSVEAISAKAVKNPFKNYSGFRICINTDKFIQGAWKHLLNDTYFNPQVKTTRWEETLDIWYTQAIEESGYGVKHHISARLLYHIGRYEDAIDQNKDAVSIALATNNLIAYSSELGNMAMALNAIGKHNQAILCLDESIPLCRRIENWQGLSSQLQALGRTRHLLHDNLGALIAYEEALIFAKMENDQSAITTVLGNISNCYNRLGDPDKVIEIIKKGLELSREQGNLQAESSQLGIIAQAYALKSEYTEAIHYCKKAIEIKKQIGEQHGECQLCCNLISYYRECGMNLEAKTTAEECLLLAKSLKSIAMENTVLLNLALLKVYL